jgi:predicted TIM-barrel fold metal-dependent hydrolase
MDTKPAVVDAHAHLYDWRQNRYPFLETPDHLFEALIGEYSSLPRVFGLDDYLKLNPVVTVRGIVWHEFMSTEPVREVAWAQQLAAHSPVPLAIVGVVDFLAPDLEKTLHEYTRIPNLSGVRQHMGWDPHRAERRFAARGDLFTDPQWLRGLGKLSSTPFRCSLEVFSHQLPALAHVVETHPEISFGVGAMGWPSGTDQQSFAEWKESLRRLAACPNVSITVSALECIFGMNWQTDQAQPWVDTVFELFGTDRVMFGSHSPIAALAANVSSPYATCLRLTAALSAEQRQAVFHDNAWEWYFNPRRA